MTREGRESFSRARRGSGEVLVMQVLAQKQLNSTNSTTTEEHPDPLESTTGSTHPTTTTRWPVRADAYNAQQEVLRVLPQGLRNDLRWWNLVV